MRSALFAVLATTALAYRGFNYGAVDLAGATRNRTSFQEEFQVARNLGTQGAFTSARLYTSLQGSSTDPIEAFDAAVNTNTSLLLGLWISGTSNIQNEVNAILSSAAKHGSAFVDLVVGISVGSEDVYRLTDRGVTSGAGPGVSPGDVANYVNQVRSALRGSPLQGKPIGHVDTYNTFVNSSGWMVPVVEAVDFVGMNAFPYFEDTKPNAIDNSNATFWADYDAVAAQVGGKEIWITETGWPSSGPRSGAAIPSVLNAETYFNEVYCSIAARDMNVWWYTLQDRDTDGGVPSFGVTSSGGHELKYEMSC
ncbi:uncharacterized protein HMPREF1541_10421 [Cyphellophora europaea CBS 101466]|uniref:Probable glucan endo-1,3-beta-glucosidase eglC n=1 Tax=Cyphellophora europaea (strain CBS 101466) TaxID=1220924 RepID=W2S7R7_CYPE1|nr:uncharacterized protein HMPREF1541_10421 [Cyphellophora europaea CBS 101466]ETN44751.1 hypothetical protein HMPREF1541_10421 [Cyphellophora europaea CBS 101466]